MSLHPFKPVGAGPAKRDLVALPTGYVLAVEGSEPSPVASPKLRNRVQIGILLKVAMALVAFAAVMGVGVFRSHSVAP